MFDFSLPASDPNNPNSAITSSADYQRRLLLAQALQKQGADYSPVQSPWQGAARLADAIMGGLDERRLNDQQAAGAKANAADWATALSGFGGASASPPAATSGGSSVPAFASSGSTGAPSADIAAALTGSAQKYGEDPATLTNIAGIESHFDPNAKNPNSSASGLMQFTKGTAAQYGLSNPFDPSQSADAGARLLHDNHVALASALGRDPTPGELYLAHQQGAGGAIKLLSNPNAPAASLVGAQAVANNGGNSNMTAGDFARMWTSRLDGQQPQGSGAPVQVASTGSISGLGGGKPALSPDAVPMAGGGVAASVNPLTGAPIPGSGGASSPALAYAPAQGTPPAAAAITNSAQPAGAAISVPGYEGTFSRAQANDADGVPSQAEWDQAYAAQKGGQQPQQAASASPAPSAPVQPQAAPAASGVNPQAIQAAQRILASPFATSAQQQVAQAILLQAMKQDQYSQPYKDSFGNVVQRAANGEIKILNSAKDSQDSQTNDIKNFEYAKNNGYAGSFTDFETQQKAQTQGNHVIGMGASLVGPDGKVLYQNQGAGGSMSDETADFMARRILAGDTHALVGLGRGAQGAQNIEKIQTRVGQLAQEQGIDPSDILQKNAEAAGMNATQRTFGTQTARMASASIEAEGGLLLARQASAAVPRGNWVPVNKLVQMGEDAVSDPALAKFRAANLTLINQYARAINPTGVPSIHDKEEATRLLGTATGPDAYNAILDQMQQEITIAHNSPTKAKTMLENIRKGQTPESGLTAPSAAPAPSLSGTGAAPASPLDQARAAIGAGAPRDAVIQRLRQNGIDPTGL